MDCWVTDLPICVTISVCVCMCVSKPMSGHWYASCKHSLSDFSVTFIITIAYPLSSQLLVLFRDLLIPGQTFTIITPTYTIMGAVYELTAGTLSIRDLFLNTADLLTSKWLSSRRWSLPAEENCPKPEIYPQPDSDGVKQLKKCFAQTGNFRVNTKKYLWLRCQQCCSRRLLFLFTSFKWNIPGSFLKWWAQLVPFLLGRFIPNWWENNANNHNWGLEVYCHYCAITSVSQFSLAWKEPHKNVLVFTAQKLLLEDAVSPSFGLSAK